jgi:hypothetical protein
MAETPQAAQGGVTDALHDLSENSRTLFRTEITQAAICRASAARPGAWMSGAAK